MMTATKMVCNECNIGESGFYLIDNTNSKCILSTLRVCPNMSLKKYASLPTKSLQEKYLPSVYRFCT